MARPGRRRRARRCSPCSPGPTRPPQPGSPSTARSPSAPTRAGPGRPARHDQTLPPKRSARAASPTASSKCSWPPKTLSTPLSTAGPRSEPPTEESPPSAPSVKERGPTQVSRARPQRWGWPGDHPPPPPGQWNEGAARSRWVHPAGAGAKRRTSGSPGSRRVWGGDKRRRSADPKSSVGGAEAEPSRRCARQRGRDHEMPRRWRGKDSGARSEAEGVRQPAEQACLWPIGPVVRRWVRRGRPVGDGWLVATRRGGTRRGGEAPLALMASVVFGAVVQACTWPAAGQGVVQRRRQPPWGSPRFVALSCRCLVGQSRHAFLTRLHPRDRFLVALRVLGRV